MTHPVQGIRTLASELATLRQTTSQEMQRSVFANYGAFIRCALHATRALAFACFRHLAADARRTRSTAKEIADLQSDLSRSRALLSGMGSVLATLREPPADDFFDSALLSVATPSKRRRGSRPQGAAATQHALTRPAAPQRVHVRLVDARARFHSRNGGAHRAHGAAGSAHRCARCFAQAPCLQRHCFHACCARALRLLHALQRRVASTLRSRLWSAPRGTSQPRSASRRRRCAP